MYTCEPVNVEKYGIKLTSFEEWVVREKEEFKKLLG
jgi:hypothetical protein